MRPLEGIKVVDLSRYGPGRYCSVILADMGAEVITIEEPRGHSQNAKWSLLSNDTSSRYLTFNRNKKSITLNLKDEEGKKVFYRLAEKADVVLEGFRPGVVRRLGVDYEVVKKMNPKVVYCSISGYGQDGPYAQRAGHDLNYVGTAGMIGLNGPKNGPPVMMAAQIGDLAGGTLQATVGILAALLARGKTGRGQYVDVSMTDMLVFLLWHIAGEYFLSNAVPKRGETLLTGDNPSYNIYETKDGKYLTIGSIEPWLWANLCSVIGRKDFAEHQNATGEKRDEIFTVLREAFRTKTRDEWAEILDKANVCAGPVLDMNEVFLDPQIRHRKMVVEIDHPRLGKIKQLGIPFKFSDTPAEIRTPPPAYGQHTEEVLTSLGYKAEQIARMRKAGVIE